MKQKKDRLDGWKEISAYLSRDIRTCQRWENDYFLPVYRLNTKSERPKVYSFKSELDEWFKRQDKKVKRRNFIFLFRRFVTYGAVVLSLTAICVVIFTQSKKSGRIPSSSPIPSNPVDWELRGTQLAFFDEKGNNLWGVRVDNPADLTGYYEDTLEDLAGMTKVLRYRRYRIDFSDVDSDGRNEVVAALMHKDPEERCIVLLDDDGTELWSRRVEFKQKYRMAFIINNYRVVKLSFEDIDHDEIEEILVLWAHAGNRFPSIFYIYNKDGEEILNYAHTGILQFFKVFKIKESKFIFLGGTNNLLANDAVLAVLDCKNLKNGLAPPYDIPPDLQDTRETIEKYIPIKPEHASQAYYVRFKQNDFTKAAGILILNVISVEAGDNGIEVMINYDLSRTSPLYFRFDSYFRLQEVEPGTSLRRDYQKLLEQGVVHVSLKEFLEKRREEIEFWDGGKWTSVPTMVKSEVR